MIGVYIRVSSQSQKSDSQKTDIQQWLTRHGHKPDEVLWFEDIESGKSLKREGFQQLQQTIFQGMVGTVIVWKLDRLARSLKEGVNVLSDWCQQDVRVVSITQQIDLSGTVGQMVAGVLFAVAEMEYQHIRERQASGIAVAKARGVYVGRKKGTTKAIPERAQELRDKGLSIAEIAAALKVSQRTVLRYLQRA
jgi:DNA invertase Pin-like site-specific DNA recombinase